MLYRLSSFLAFVVFSLFFKIKIKGKNSFPQNKPFILASNHVSNLDPVVLGAVCPRRLNFLAKEELFSGKLGAFYLKNVGAIPLKRGTTDIKILRSALKVLKEKPLVIFPQGRRRADYDEFESGVGFLQKKTNLPIIAAKIYGTDSILPKGACFIRRGRIKVIFDRVEGLDKEDNFEEIASKVMAKIKSL